MGIDQEDVMIHSWPFPVKFSVKLVLFYLTKLLLCCEIVGEIIVVVVVIYEINGKLG